MELPVDFRVRISSIEPDGFDEQFFQLLEHPKVTPHLHLCLQSASEKVLLHMRRMYTFKSYKSIIERIRNINPLFNITTDVIVGFPGESEKDFEDSLKAVSELNFGHVHTFKYSKRDGTRAAGMTNIVTEKEKTERSERLRKLAAENKLKFRKQFIGLIQNVLVESISEDGWAKGYGENYVPVKFKMPEAEKNTIYQIKISNIDKADIEDPILVGECI